ncbi:MAG: archaeosortase/exosortase family protein [Candidatus Diapherotrites archaeon]|nr:archaeosortase/exosortase family protein [Candidatus Diapherotrites archaeon]
MNFKSFALRFIIFFSGMYFALLVFDTPILKTIVGHATYALLLLSGKHVELIGNMIVAPTYAFVIVSSCTGIVSFSIFAALLYATNNIDSEKKVIYALLSFPIFLLWNILRVYLTMITDSFVIHDTLWIASVVIVLLLYAIVLRIENKHILFK